MPAWVTFLEANAPYPGSSGGQAELPDKAKEAPPSCGCLLSNENSGLERTPTARNGSKIRRTYMLLHQANKFPSQENNTIPIYICSAKRKCCTSCYLLPLSEAFAMILAKVFARHRQIACGINPMLAHYEPALQLLSQRIFCALLRDPWRNSLRLHQLPWLCYRLPFNYI